MFTQRSFHWVLGTAIAAATAAFFASVAWGTGSAIPADDAFLAS